MQRNPPKPAVSLASCFSAWNNWRNQPFLLETATVIQLLSAGAVWEAEETGLSARASAGSVKRTSTLCSPASRNLARGTRAGRHKWWGRGRLGGAMSCSTAAARRRMPREGRRNKSSRGTRVTEPPLGTHLPAGAFYEIFRKEEFFILCHANRLSHSCLMKKRRLLLCMSANHQNQTTVCKSNNLIADEENIRSFVIKELKDDAINAY